LPNVHFSIVLIGVGGACVYVCSMSALGRWLAHCRESTTMAAIAPLARAT
jgi:hypothetical protein